MVTHFHVLTDTPTMRSAIANVETNGHFHYKPWSFKVYSDLLKRKSHFHVGTIWFVIREVWEKAIRQCV